MKLVSLLLISLSQIASTPLPSSLSKLDEACNGSNPSCDTGLFCEPDHKKDCSVMANPPGVCKQICKKDNDCKKKNNICESYSGGKDCPGLDKPMGICAKGPNNMCDVKKQDCKKGEICDAKKGSNYGACKKQ